MRAHRRIVGWMLGVLGAAGSFMVVLGAPATATPAASLVPVPWCSDAPGTFPCISAATRNGVSVHSDPTWSVQIGTFTVSGDPSQYLHIAAEKNGSYTLGAGALSDTWSIQLAMGTSFVPRVATGHARDVTVTRSIAISGQYSITITGTPVTVTNGCSQSSWPWSCPTVATSQWIGYFDAQVTDYAVWPDAVTRDAMYGMDYFTNLDATSVPPEIVTDPATGDDQLLIRMANSHYLMDGTTVVHGHSELRIPNSFLQVGYGVPDPASMTGTSLIATVSGPTAGSGSVTVAQEASNTAMLVTMDGVTFSPRKFTVRRGTITPTRPSNVHTKRLAPHRGRVSFTGSKPRGAKITGYQARCVINHGTQVRWANGSQSPILVLGLTHGRGYYCTVHAMSRAGRSAFSNRIWMRRYA